MSNKIQNEKTAVIAEARQIINRVKFENRELTQPDSTILEAKKARVEVLNEQLRGKALVDSVLGMGTVEHDNGEGGSDGPRFMSLRKSGVKKSLTSQFGSKLGTPGVKALLDQGDPYTSIDMDAEPIRMTQVATSLLEILPTAKKGVAYRFMRQTVRTNNAAVVAPGALKPTSVFGLVPVDGRLGVVAHISEPIDKYVLQDGPSLGQFVALEMVEGLHQALEAQLISGTGVGENLTELANTSGIQTQAFDTAAIVTCRAAVTKL